MNIDSVFQQNSNFLKVSKKHRRLSTIHFCRLRSTSAFNNKNIKFSAFLCSKILNFILGYQFKTILPSVQCYLIINVLR